MVDSTLTVLPGTYPNAAGGSFDAAGNFYFGSLTISVLANLSQVDMTSNPPAISLFATSNLIDGPDGLALYPNGDLISAVRVNLA